MRTGLGGVWLAQIAACLVRGLAASSEYDTAQIAATLASMPRALAVLAAKAGAVVALVAGAAAVGTAGSLVAGRVALGGVDRSVRSLGDPLAWSFTDTATVPPRSRPPFT